MVDTPQAVHEAGDLLQAGLDVRTFATLHDVLGSGEAAAGAGPVLFKSCGWAGWGSGRRADGTAASGVAGLALVLDGDDGYGVSFGIVEVQCEIPRVFPREITSSRRPRPERPADCGVTLQNFNGAENRGRRCGPPHAAWLPAGNRKDDRYRLRHAR